MDVQLPEDEQTSPFEGIVGTRTFVDKTLMIKEILSGPRCLHITAPPLFGKTTNLDMLRKFFEIESGLRVPKEITSNYFLFANNNLAITRDEESMQHFGNYVVIYLDCICIRELNKCTEMVQFCLEIIHNAYKQHEYLKYSDRIVHKKEVDTWCDTYLWRSYTSYDVATGLRILLLSLTFHHRPIPNIMVLVDNIDAPFLNLIRNQTRFFPLTRESYIQCKNIYFHMLKQLTTFNHGIRLIFSGTFRTESTLLYEDEHYYDFLSDETYTPFYGATSTEIEKLLDEFRVPPHIRAEVACSFGGYMSKYGKYHMYHLHGVLVFLQQYHRTKRFDFDFSTINFDVNLQQPLHNFQFQDVLWTLITGHQVWCNYYVSRVNVEPFLENVAYMENKNTLLTSHTALFAIYLLQLGYVSYAEVVEPWLLEESCCTLCQLKSENRDAGYTNPHEHPGPCQVTIPCQRAFSHLEKLLLDYYSRTFSYPKDEILNCGLLLITLGPSTPRHHFERFRDALCRLFQRSYFSEGNSAYVALYPIVCSIRRYCDVYRGSHIDSKFMIFLRDGFEVCICAHIQDKNADTALRAAHATKMTNFGDGNPIMEVMCIGINVVPYAEGMQGVRVCMKCELAVYAGPSSPYLNTVLYSSQ